MCMFSGTVSHVANTKIFARSAGDGWQFLVYSMQYQADSELAMILPLPVIANAQEDAIRFIDLSNYPKFFDDIQNGFIEPLTFGGEPAPASRQSLKVHGVGSFQASFVPTLQDFPRLDKRFQLPAQTWDQLPLYSNYGFAVFKLKAGAKTIHPMAFAFQKRNLGELFFSTFHIHDGKVEEKAEFDHILYCQSPKKLIGWRPSADPEYRKPLAAIHFMDCDKAQGVIDPTAIIQMRPLYGMYPNKDFIFQEQ